MNLNHHIAQRIVEHIAADLDLAFWIVDRSAHILAGTTAHGAADTLPANAIGGTGADQQTLHLPLSYGEEIVGELILVNPPPRREVAAMARTLAELIIHQMATFEQLLDRQWALDKFISDLLLTQSPKQDTEVLWQTAKLLGLDLTLPRVAIVLQVGPLLAQQPADRQERAGYEWMTHEQKQVRHHLLRELQRCVTSDERAIYSFLDHQYLVGLLPVTPQPVDSWRRPLQTCLQQLLTEVQQTMGIGLSAGIGEYYTEWQQLPCSYRDARFALETGTTLHGVGRAFTTADLGLAAFVCNSSQTTTAKLATYLLRPLLQQPELLATLDSFLRANLSPSVAAQRLHVHRHTLTYRLNKIADLTGLDPRTLSAAAQFLAALLWYKLENPDV